MKANVGGVDKIIRILAGLALIGAAATGLIGAWGFVGAIAVLTGLLGWCPAYVLFGMSTCTTKSDS